MATKTPKADDGTTRGVLLAYLILLLHVALIALLGLLVLFFRGVVNYMLWIFLGGTALLIISGWLFYRRMKREGKSLREMMRSPDLQGRSLEISFLGGFASMKIGESGSGMQALDTHSVPPSNQIEDASTQRVRELSTLASLLEKNLITAEEYEAAKRRLLDS
jgi:hypothetical protein